MFSAGGVRGIVACAIVFSMLAVIAAPLWHHHDHDRQHHNDGDIGHECPVCLAVQQPTGGTLPGGTQLVLALLPAVLSQAPRADEPVVRFLPILWPCGPPVRRD